MTTDTLALLDDVLTLARKAGADNADAVMDVSSSVSVRRRLGKAEALTRSEESEIGLRVFVGKRQAIVSSSDTSASALKDMAERAVAMARAVPDDPWCGIADPDQIMRSVDAQQIAALELYDTSEISVEDMAARADAAEDAARAIKGISNSDGSEFAAGHNTTAIAASNGFAGKYQSSGFSLSVSVIAGSGTGMETDYAYDSTTFLSDLRDAAMIGREAGERATRALNPRKGTTRMMPIILDRRISGSIVNALAAACSGSLVAKGTSMFKHKMGEQVAAPAITIIDDPFIKRGARSNPFDDEGLMPQKRAVINGGVLSGWFLDLASARQLGLNPTGNGARGTSSPPSPKPANLYLQNGTHNLKSLIGDIEQGFYVTEFLGSGGSVVTGDYSRGAKGFWIENGEITYAVSEMTIAGNLKSMFMNTTPANDLEIRYGIDAPTLRIDGMTVA